MTNVIAEIAYNQAKSIPSTINFSRNEYNSHIKSRKWKKLRYERLELDCFKCFACGEDNRLQMHHTNYENFGNETLDDIVTLCESCHIEVHKMSVE